MAYSKEYYQARRIVQEQEARRARHAQHVEDAKGIILGLLLVTGAILAYGIVGNIELGIW